MANHTLTLSETRLIGKAMQILRILADARNKPEMFPEKDGRVIYSDYFKCKALSKEEILAWQNANDGGLEETKLTGEEFDAMIGLSGLVDTINQFHEGTEESKATYYCFSESTEQNKSNNEKQDENFKNINRYISTLFEINNHLGDNNSHGTNIMLLMSDLSHELNDKSREENKAETLSQKTDFVFDEQTVKRVSHEMWLLQNLVAHKTESGMENPDEFTSDDYVKYFGKTKEYAETMLHILFKGGFLGITTYKEGEVSFRFKVTRFFIKYNESGNPILSNTK